ncbi:MAG: hypothetical protein MJ170_00955 [Alphaproteobacteria bacterium]|nr:hypothetical protein [Alphaproteobacteria bacterium]
MKISVRPMTLEEVWEFVLDIHHSFHTHLKHFGYTINSFVPKPKHPIIQEMFAKEALNDADINKYYNFFKNEIYDVTHLTKYQETLTSYIAPTMDRCINEKLVPLLKSWNTTMPQELEILCTYGAGASYSRKSDDKAKIIFRMSRYPDDKEAMLNTMLHEFIHLLIEDSIIQKYNVPQNFKERIVDIIGTEFFGKHIQERFINPFVDKYITPENIKKDLPCSIAKMMADYLTLQTINQANKR